MLAPRSARRPVPVVRPVRPVLGTLIALVATAALTGCAEDETDAAGAATTSTRAPDTTGNSSDAGTGSEPAEAAPAGDFCTDLESLVQGSQNFFETSFAEVSGGPAPSPDEVRTAAEPLPDLIVQASLSAPADLVDDLEVMGPYLLSVTGTFGAVGYDVDKVDSVPQRTPEVNAAEDVLNEYARTECGFDPDVEGQ